MAARPTPRKTTSRPRVDWPTALGYFLTLPPSERTYAAVAAKFSVSSTAVRNHANRNGWDKAAAEVDRKARAAAERAATKTASERAAQTARIRDAAADAIELKLVPKNPKDLVKLEDALVVRIWELADRQHRLDEGTATERIEVTEARDAIARVFEIAGRYVPAEHRQAFLEEIDRATTVLDAEATEDLELTA